MSRPAIIDEKTESARLAVLHSYGILDTEAEAEFDKIVQETLQEFQMPVAALSLMDANRVWFKAQQGLNTLTELPREVSFCQHAFNSSGTFVVPDAQADDRFATLPLVRQENGYRFYMGTPLRTMGGQSIGTLCVLDRSPHQPTAQEMATLRALADRAMALLELRRSHRIQASSFPPFPAKTGPNGTAGRLLIVDDDTAVREFAAFVTRQLGYAVTEAVNGAEALRVLDESSEPFDLMLTDVNMPVMDGLALVHTLNQRAKHPRIAVMSGRFDPQIRSALRAAGVVVLLGKPFSIVELELALRQAQATAAV